MNYRHAYHAGNFADCMKHALLVALVRAMQRKPAPMLLLDTHAGAGSHRLDAPEAMRTGEAASGILRLLADAPPALGDYLDLVRDEVAGGRYPGSPALALRLLRPQDRLVACELHPAEHARLRRLADARLAAHRRDGFEALGALLPPAGMARALALIDPPYEAADEWERLRHGLLRARRRMAGAVLAAWYPIKQRAPSRALHEWAREAGLGGTVAAELWLRPVEDADRLNGCGLLVARPPFGFAAAAAPILAALADRLGEPGANWHVAELRTDE